MKLLFRIILYYHLHIIFFCLNKISKFSNFKFNIKNNYIGKNKSIFKTLYIPKFNNINDFRFKKMVNCTSLKRITDFVTCNRLKLMKKWSLRNRQRRDGHISTHIFDLRKQIRSILSLLSGNDICEMLKGLRHFFFQNEVIKFE